MLLNSTSVQDWYNHNIASQPAYTSLVAAIATRATEVNKLDGPVLAVKFLVSSTAGEFVCSLLADKQKAYLGTLYFRWH